MNLATGIFSVEQMVGGKMMEAFPDSYWSNLETYRLSAQWWAK
jgi:hypothetical protein